MKTELTIEVEPDFLVEWAADIYTLVEHDVQAVVTATWRIAQRGRFDMYGQVEHHEWPELVDYTVDKVFVDGVETPLETLSADVRATIVESPAMFREIERRGTR